MSETIVIDEDESPSPQTIDARARRSRPLTASTLPYLPGLDGLRAVAVVAVVLYHAGVTWMPGGFLGVEIFFVLSGFLITSLLVQELGSTGRIHLPRFWVRRARRLLPAAYASIAGVLLWTVAADPEGLDRLRREIPAALVYATNWLLISGNESYFESIGRASPLRHLWSLAVEEQFYLVWPVVFALAYRLLSHRALLRAILLTAAASTVWMIALYEPFSDPSRVYYATSTRMAGPLIGAALALCWQPWKTVHDPVTRRRAQHAGVVGSVGLLVAVLTMGEYEPRLYRGGFAIVGLLTALVIIGATSSGTSAARLLSAPVLRWIGQRSYGIYLWHWPVVVFTRPHADVSFDGMVLFTYRISLTLLLATLSHRLIEMPWRLGRLRTASIRPGFVTTISQWRRLRPVAPFIVLTGLLLAVPMATRPPQRPTAAEVLPPLDPVSAPDTIAPTTTAPAPAPSVSAPTPAPPVAPAPAPPPTAPPPMPQLGTLVVGDSVPLGARDALIGALGGDTVVDAVVGRQGAQGREAVQRWVDGGWSGTTLVMHLGNNGMLRPQDLDAMFEAVGTRRVVVMTVRVPRSWESATNDEIRAAVGRHANATLVDWREASAGHPEWFANDDIHLSPSGASAYAAMVAEALTA